MNLNKVLLIGNLTRDPEMRTTQSGQTVTTLGIATNRTWKNAQTGQKEQQVEYHSVVCWGKLGELAGQYLTKGRSAYIEGRIATRSWQDAKTGEKKYRTEVIAENIQFGPRAAGAEGAPYQPSNNDQNPSNENQQSQQANSQDQSSAATEEDVPIIQEDEPDIEVKDIPF